MSFLLERFVVIFDFFINLLDKFVFLAYNTKGLIYVLGSFFLLFFSLFTYIEPLLFKEEDDRFETFDSTNFIF